MNANSDKQFIIRGLTMACKSWGEKNSSSKVLALHGWLDNAASFDFLAPEMTGSYVVAPDLFGQGLSEPRPQSATYHLWDDLDDMFNLVEQLEWETFSLIGHSRGAMLSVLFAACFPEKVDRIILLDGILPVAVDVENSVAQLKQHVSDMNKKNTLPRFFVNRKDAVNIRAKAGNFSYEVAEALALRQLEQTDEGFFWSADKRLKAASAIKLTEEHNQQFLNSLKCPVTVALADEGMARYEPVKALEEQFPQFEWLHFSGHHHFHMQGQVKELAKLCCERLKV